MNKLSHIDKNGKASMVDTAEKEITMRQASASVEVILDDTAYAAIAENRSTKGDVLTVAKIAGIQAAKRTAELIPLCHSLPLDHVEIVFELNEVERSIIVRSTVRCTARTGAEMEAMTACSVCALTIYDMLKAVQRDICITNLMLQEKQGGKSGTYKR